MKNWICMSCGHEVLSDEKPQPIHWTDGHVCYFMEYEEQEDSVYGWEPPKKEV